MNTEILSPLFITLVAIILFASAITIHEIGHFIVAKILGIKVITFSIGFGPRLFEKNFKGTVYCFSSIPLGGYVRCYAALPDLNSDQFKFSTSPLMRFLAPLGPLEIEVIKPLRPDSSQNILTRNPASIAFFTMGGILANVTSAMIAAFILIKFLLPFSELSTDLSIGEVLIGSPAADVGVMQGDRILSVDNSPVKTWGEVENALGNSKYRDIRLTLKRFAQNAQIEVTVHRTPLHRFINGKPQEIFVSGFKPRRNEIYMSNSTAVAAAFSLLAQTTSAILFNSDEAIEHSADDSGPVSGILDLGHEASNSLLDFTGAFISLSILLALTNLLPIPALDGGNLLILLIEHSTQTALSMNLKSKITDLGLAAMLILFVVVFGREAWTSIYRLF